jgi:hypothetical protein
MDDAPGEWQHTHVNASRSASAATHPRTKPDERLRAKNLRHHVKNIWKNSEKLAAMAAILTVFVTVATWIYTHTWPTTSLNTYDDRVSAARLSAADAELKAANARKAAAEVEELAAAGITKALTPSSQPGLQPPALTAQSTIIPGKQVTPGKPGPPSPLAINVPTPGSQGDALQAALDQWRLLGVRGDPESLRILQTVTASDAAQFSHVNAVVWPEIRAATDVLNAPKLRLSPSTVARLPVYVKSLQQNPLDEKLAERITERLKAAGFANADERHAAVIFFVEPPVFEDVNNYAVGDQEFWGESVKLTAYSEYNINSEQFVPRTQFPGHRNSSTHTTQDDLKGCALLDAGNLAADKFIEMVGIPLPPSITC